METNHCVVILDLFSAELMLPMASVKEHKAKAQTSCFSLLSEVEVLIYCHKYMSSFIIDFKPIVLRAVCCVQVTIQLTYQKVNHSMNYIPANLQVKKLEVKWLADRPQQTRHKTELLPTIRHCDRHHKIHSNRVPAT